MTGRVAIGAALAAGILGAATTATTGLAQGEEDRPADARVWPGAVIFSAAPPTIDGGPDDRARSAPDRRPGVAPQIAGESLVLVGDRVIEFRSLSDGSLRASARPRSPAPVGRIIRATRPERLRFGATEAAGVVVASLAGSGDAQEHWRGIPIRRGTNGRRLVGIDADTSKVVWDHAKTLEGDLAEVEICAPPTSHDGIVYAAGLRGSAEAWLTAVDARTGSPSWSTRLGAGETTLTMFGEAAHEPSSGVPLIAAGVAYHATGVGFLVAVDAATGRVRWKARYPRPTDEPQKGYYPDVPEPGWSCSAPVLVAGAVVAAPVDGSALVAFEAASGKLLWTREREGARHLLGAGAGLVVVGGPSHVDAIEVASGKLAWRVTTEATGRGLVVGPHVAIPGARTLTLIDLPSGKLAASAAWPDGVGDGDLSVAGRHLIVASPRRVTVLENDVYH